jgi:hypothetical protein
LRGQTVRRVSAAFAGLALYLQLALAGPGMLSLVAPSDSINFLAAHALCLAAQAENQQRPADGAPAAPVHDHTLFCCIWHPLPGDTPQAAQAVIPIGYAIVAVNECNEPVLVPGSHHGLANARAPPVLA